MDVNRTVQIFDTTLRDGEQTPQLAFSVEEKVTIARKLDELGVDIIEAGFPVNSRAEAEAVNRIAKEVSATVCAISRVVPTDLAATAKTGAAMVDVFCPTSDLQMEHAMRTTRAEVLQMSRDAVKFVKDSSLLCMFTPMDATRTDPEFLAEVCRAAEEEGADWIGLTDTVGVGTPNGEPIPIADADGRNTGYKKDRSGNVVLSRLDEALLREIAETTGGRYYPATLQGHEVGEMLKVLGRLERGELGGTQRRRVEERFQVPAAVAVVLLLLAVLVPEARRVRGGLEAEPRERKETA